MSSLKKFVREEVNNALIKESARIEVKEMQKNLYEVVKTMKFVPVSRDAIILLAAATVMPIVPLLLTMMPLEELLKKLFGILF